MSNKAITYRPDIDGLRALAVLAVVIFHFNKGWLPGGFVGVDIFFVISGYLITGIVSKQALSGQFSFADFYMRRIRRILPAAMFVTLTTLIFGSAFMLPEDAKSLSLSALASTLSAANIYFWKFLDTSYFAASSDIVPLLHMWSLGVEEQFYLIWPALLLVTLKARGQWLTVLVATLIAAAAFWYGQIKLSDDPTFAYYMLPSRAGELLIGGITYFVASTFKSRINGIVANLIAIIGASLLAGSLLYIRERDGFPGFLSLAPTLGASLVIAAGSFSNTAISRVLAVRPMVYIGLISFSLYLWHWPVLAFYRYGFGEPSTAGYFICLSAMLLLTLFSYYMVEVPFRTKRSNQAFTFAVPTCTALTLALAGVLYSSNGLIPLMSPSSYKDDLLTEQSGSEPASTATYVCQNTYKPGLFSSDKCIIGDLSKPPTALLIGDSNAAHYAGYLSAIAKSQGVSIRNVEYPACPPFPDQRAAKYIKEGYRVTCPAYNIEAFKQSKSYDTIIVGASWPNYYATDKSNFFKDFDAMIDELSHSGKNIIIALKIPTFNSFDRQCSQKALKIPYMDCSKKTHTPDLGEATINKLIVQHIALRKNVSYFTIRNLICRDGSCSAFSGATQLYYDGGHLSRVGSEKLGEIALATGNTPKALTSLNSPGIASN